ncbi:GNAT family N-acetyltransferase [Nocardioides bruguierae]|uniref:GNAT family N-acetyltransferase n=1 Tax=Nocardioides bruguierae TaxID=2945102 RepID=A0A9X2IEP7_9ACTN|nr:GNAT family N-acetyltransferase [Nocardioides bruguierae]MCM0618835.1 GNAT family N-acetyltransferase [Nocardioides bruguierae]
MSADAAVEVRPALLADLPAADAVEAAAFGDEGTVITDLLAALRAAGRMVHELVGADEAGRVRGHVGLSRGWVDARPSLVEVLVLSPLGVAPDAQGRGLGAALVRAALARAEADGVPALFLEGDPGYYGRLGFERADTHGFERPSVRVPDAAFQVVTLPGHESWQRGRLVYADPFWALDAVGLRDPFLAEVEEWLS